MMVFFLIFLGKILNWEKFSLTLESDFNKDKDGKGKSFNNNL